jgi:hypothetical protein
MSPHKLSINVADSATTAIRLSVFMADSMVEAG